ncbi:hypothetical protein ACFW6F_21725 [Streptomyces sp. NPDC058746]|uniref:hypothetical protein n=1 Tax=Streptomyces sp. NPDC058746 TaxID=3346622 RepID=UPI00369D5116
MDLGFGKPLLGAEEHTEQGRAESVPLRIGGSGDQLLFKELLGVAKPVLSP